MELAKLFQKQTLPELSEYLDKLKQKVEQANQKNSDFILLITGRERSGKSNVALRVMEHFDYNENNVKDHIVIDIKEALPLIKKRIEQIENGKANDTFIINVDEGATYYNKWRQSTREAYEVFQVYRLMGFSRIFWILQYQDVTDAGEIFLKGRVDEWWYTFTDRERKNFYVTIIPEWLLKRAFVLTKLSRKFRTKIAIAHQFPSLFFKTMQQLAKRTDLGFLRIYRVKKAELERVYNQKKIEINKKRIEELLNGNKKRLKTIWK